MSARFARRSAALAIAALATLAFASSASAKTYVPHKLGDHAPNGCTGNDCTLREAVIAANARPGADKIMLTGGKTYKLSRAGASENAAATGDLDITESLEIRSASKQKVATINAQGIDRVFDVDPLAANVVTAKFKLLNIKRGNAGAIGAGGAIHAQGDTVKIIRSTVQRNTAANGGGLALVGGQATISQSTFNDNIANGAIGTGGGIDASGLSTLNVVNSTIANNAATGSGGGVAVGGGTASLNSSTVARNLANSDSAGGGSGGGLSQATSTFTVRNSIVAQNSINPTGGGTDPNCFGAYTSAGVNLFDSITAACTGFSFPPNILAIDPKLAVGLAKNGGPTKTIALLKNSPAINAADTSPSRDQRGVKRKNPDIGAFERR